MGEAEVPQGLEAAFATMTRQGVGALLVSFTPILSTYRTQIAELAVKHRLPAIHDRRQFAEQGGLMSYGRNPADAWRVVVSYLDRILKGAKPADRAVEQPTIFELVLNRACREGGRGQRETAPPGSEPEPRNLDGRVEGNRDAAAHRRSPRQEGA